ncbi:MAG: TIGR00266 family protein [Oscillospiraceae bacterium]|nr:TIGR00266 family protein [Oscillospiraceae bacterium]
MKYQILYRDAFPLLECQLGPGETVRAESDAMVAMSPTLEINGALKGSVLGGLARKMLAGESFFFQEVAATKGSGQVLFAPALPGAIHDLQLNGSYGLRVQKNGYLASTCNINVSTAVQNLAQGLFSRAGLFVLGINGTGTVFLSSYGAVHRIDLAAGEEVVIDNGHLVAWVDTMDYKIEKASNGWMSSIMSGECLVCRFRGPGFILIQTRNPSALGAWVRGIVSKG